MSDIVEEWIQYIEAVRGALSAYLKERNVESIVSFHCKYRPAPQDVEVAAKLRPRGIAEVSGCISQWHCGDEDILRAEIGKMLDGWCLPDHMPNMRTPYERALDGAGVPRDSADDDCNCDQSLRLQQENRDLRRAVKALTKTAQRLQGHMVDVGEELKRYTGRLDSHTKVWGHRYGEFKADTSVVRARAEYLLKKAEGL